jgi:sulfonate dioxygenase
MSYEVNPPGTTFLNSLAGPACGGDTLYVNCMTAYDRLSPLLQSFFSDLSALHSGAFQSAISAKTSFPRRPTIESVHPLVRQHPVTKRKALYVNHEYIEKIVGLKKVESDMILNFLYDHIHRGLDYQTRVRWEKGTVAVYDNRTVQHSVTLDYTLNDGAFRHLVRLTPQA